MKIDVFKAVEMEKTAASESKEIPFQLICNSGGSRVKVRETIEELNRTLITNQNLKVDGWAVL